MELQQYLKVALRWWWLIVLSVAVAAGSTYYTTRLQPSIYRTKTTLMIGRTIESANPDYSSIYMGQELAQTYAQLAKREPVLRGAVESLGLDMGWEALAGNVSVTLVPNTQLLEIGVIDTNPQRAKALADAIAQQLILLTPQARNAQSEDTAFAAEQLAELQANIERSQEEIERLTQERDAAVSARRIQDLQTQINTLESKIGGWQSTYSQLLVYVKGGDVNVITVVEEAAVPQWPIGPNLRNNVMLAAAIGLALALGGAFLVEYLDDSIKEPSEIEKRLGLPMLGAIARVSGSESQAESVTTTQPRSTTTEAYRMLGINLRYALPAKTHKRVILVTSAGPGEGKTTTICNLGVVMAQAGARTILIDADLHRPRLHKAMNAENVLGLSSFLVGEAETLEQILQPTEVEGLQVITSGPIPPNAADLLGSQRMRELLDRLGQEADVILLDTPPILAVADTAILSTATMGVVVVLELGRTRLRAFMQAMDSIKKVGGNLLGVVVNRLDMKSRSGYYYSSYYYSEVYGDEASPAQGRPARVKPRGVEAWLLGRGGKNRRQRARPRPPQALSESTTAAPATSATISGSEGTSSEP